ncbi:MAG: alpha/beta fold hydrolase [Acidobacteriaceae bacterium]
MRDRLVKGAVVDVAHGSQFVIVRPQPEAASRLFCFPHAGGGPMAFFDWPERLGKQVECVCLQYAGRGQRLREQPLVSVGALVREIIAGFERWTDKPFAFYGHSFGGVVAFELARALRSIGLPGPHHLFVGATRPPHLELPFSPIHGLGDKEFVEKVQARYGGIPAAIYNQPDILEMFLPAMRADFTAYETYRFATGEPLEIPISAFAGKDDAAVLPESLPEWSLHTVAEFDITLLPDGHFFSAASGGEVIGALQNRIAAHLNGQKYTLAGRG